MSDKYCLILGASQGIGLGFVKQLIKEQNYTTIYTVYRNQNTAQELFNLQKEYPHNIVCLQGDITQEKDIVNIVEKIKSTANKLHLVINCVGILHEEEIEPEKKFKTYQ